MSPLQRSIALMKARGYTVAIVEHWNQWARIRQDLYGFIDLLCVKPREAHDGGIVGVQVTGLSGWHPHLKKIKSNTVYPIFKAAGGQVVLHGWRKLKIPVTGQISTVSNSKIGLLRPPKSDDTISRPDKNNGKKGPRNTNSGHSRARKSQWVAKEEWL